MRSTRKYLRVLELFFWTFCFGGIYFLFCFPRYCELDSLCKQMTDGLLTRVWWELVSLKTYMSSIPIVTASSREKRGGITVLQLFRAWAMLGSRAVEAPRSTCHNQVISLGPACCDHHFHEFRLSLRSSGPSQWIPFVCT